VPALPHRDRYGIIVLKYRFEVQPPPGAALYEELKVHVRHAVGPWKYPRWIEFVDELPRTATGKLQRQLLRTRPRG
jgi:4-hydroxybenzoate-CoA ligase